MIMPDNSALKLLTIEDSSSVADTDPGVFSSIYNADINMAIWQRSLDLPTQVYVASLIKSPPVFQTLQAVMQEGEIAPWLSAHLPNRRGKPALIADISRLCEMFSVLFDLQRIGLRMVLLSQAMCPRFHVDHIPCRMVTTYGGPATEWLENNRVDRTRLGKGRRGKPDDQSDVFHSPRHIRQLTVGDAALLKGESWHGNEGRGAVHRSPPMPSGAARLMLSLDFG